MKIGIFGSPNAIESKWLEEAAKENGHQAERISTDEVTIKIKNNKFTLESSHDFRSFDIFLVRGIMKKVKAGNDLMRDEKSSLMLLQYIKNNLKIPVVDKRLVDEPFILLKSFTALQLSEADLPVPNTYIYPKRENALKNISELKIPIIVKDLRGAKGRNIYKFDSQSELTQFIKKTESINQYAFQQFLPTDGDIRVFVIGDKVLGAMKRFVISGDFRANISQGAKAEKYELTPELKDLAQKAAKVTNTEIAGVDFIESDGKYYIIEVNRAPQFKGFRKYTKTNPAPKIIEYLEKQAEQKQ